MFITRSSLTRRRHRHGRRRLESVLFGWPAICLAGGLSLASMLGCMNISLGGSSDKPVAADESGVYSQEGKILIRPGTEKVVYYPVPYASTPNLELDHDSGYYTIVEQKETYFRVRFLNNSPPTADGVVWKARGVRGQAQTTTPTVATETVPAPTTPGTLPQAPVAVSTPLGTQQ